MKNIPASLFSILRAAASPAMLVLLPLLLIGWAERAAAHPISHPFSPALHNEDTYDLVGKVSKHAQDMQTEDDTMVRLIPKTIAVNHTNEELMNICCLHANILDYYLNNVLPNHEKPHSHIKKLESVLTRVSEDLQNHGCNVTRYHDHQQAVTFRQKLTEMGPQGINKAVGEIDILFAYLQDFCVKPKNSKKPKA